MRKIGILLSLVIFIGVMIVGYKHWNEKLHKTVSQGSVAAEENLANSAEKNIQTDTSFTINRGELEVLLTNLPEQIKIQFLNSYDNGEPIQMTLVGSPALASESNGWSIQVKNRLEKLYGSDFLEITIVEFDGTSTEFLGSKEADSVVQSKSDIVFFEALTLEDNGLVEIEHSHENIKQFINQIKTNNPKTIILLQPPHPIHAATYYPLQVEALASFAEEEEIPYFDHWPYWPDPNSDEMNNYLNENGHPNENGHEVWANAVIQYFSGQQNE